MLSAIRIAVPIASPEVERGAFHRSAITIISRIPVEDLLTIRDAITDVFSLRWKVIDPDLTHGHLAKNPQVCFTRLVTENRDKIEPQPILLADGLCDPRHTRLRWQRVTREESRAGKLLVRNRYFV